MDMGIRKTVGSIFSVVGGVGAVVYFLEVFGFITLPLVKGAEYLADYFGALALVVFFLCTLWGGYQIGIWRSKKSVSTSIVAPQPRAVTAKMQPKLDEIEKGLFEVMLERPTILSRHPVTHMSTKFPSSSVSTNTFGLRQKPNICSAYAMTIST